MNINILDLQQKYSMEKGALSRDAAVPAGVAQSGQEIGVLIQRLYDQLLPLIDVSVNSVLVTNCGTQQQTQKSDFYVARISREFFWYKEVENEVATKNVTIDFQKRLAVKNGKPFGQDHLQLFSKIIFHKLAKAIQDKEADVLEEFYDENGEGAS